MALLTSVSHQPPAAPRDPELALIVADGLCPRIAELLPEARHELLALQQHPNPLAAIGQELEQRRRGGAPVAVLQIVAHGRPGAVQLGGRWIDRSQLIANAGALGTWGVERIELWGCDVGRDREFVALLEELSGAEVWASRQPVGRGNWKLQHLARSANTCPPPSAPFSPAALQAWPHHLDATMNTQLSLFDLTGSTSSEYSPELVNALAEAERLIHELLQGDDAASTLFALFNGGSSEPSAEWLAGAEQFISGLLSGALSVDLELRASSDLLGAYGAYAAAGPDGEPVIYLNEAWVEQFTPEELTRLILEEAGHWIDNQLNGTADTAGDEGEAFAATVLGLELSEAEWDRIHSENDTIRITIDGVEIEVELAALLFNDTAYFAEHSSATDGKADLESSELRLLGLVDGTLGAVKFLFTSDPASAPLYSGNNVRGTLYAINANNQVVGTYYGEISRLYKTGSTVQAAQMFVYPDPNNVNNTGSPSTTIFIDFGLVGGPSFNPGQLVKTSSDPVDTALNKLLAPAPLAATPLSNDGALEAGTSPGAEATGGLFSGISGGATAYSIVNNELSASTSGVSITTVSSSSSSVNLATTTPDSNGEVEIIGLYGSLFVKADGTYRYVVADSNPTVNGLNAGDTLSETFSYTVTDGQSVVTNNLRLTVNGQNDAPAAKADFNIAKEAESPDEPGFTATGNVLDNDNDVDNGDSKAVIGIQLNGTITGTSVTTSLNYASFGGSFSSGNGDIYPAYRFNNLSNQYELVLDSNGNAVTLTQNGTGQNVTFQLSDPTAVQAGDVLFVTRDSGTNYLEVATVDTTPGTSNIIEISSFTGTLADGASVNFTGGPEGLSIVEIIYDQNGRPASAILSQSVTITSQAISISGAATPGSTIIGEYGTLVLGPNGAYTYAPFANNPDLVEGQIADEVFTYTMQDHAGAESTSTLTIAVQGSSPADPDALPEIADGDPGSAFGAAVEQGTLVEGEISFGNILENDTDGVTLTAVGSLDGALTSATFNTQVEGIPNKYPSGSYFAVGGQYGTLYVNALGDYFYEVNDANPEVNAINNLETLQDIFNYTISNNAGGINGSTLSIQINGNNDAPVAEADVAAAQEAGGSPSNPSAGSNPSGNVLTNDSDVDNPSIAEDSNGYRVSLVSAIDPTDQTGQSFLAGEQIAAQGETSINGLYGTLYIQQNGAWRYEVNQANSAVNALSLGETASERFEYTVFDGELSDTEILLITIYGANDAVDINSIFINEASPYAVFTITGSEGVAVDIALGTYQSTGPEDTKMPATLTGGEADIGQQLEYYDPEANGGQGNWLEVTPGIIIPDSGTLLVRVAINPDARHEGNEAFQLNVTTSDGSTAFGVGVINDEGQGDFYGPNNTDGLPDAPGENGLPADLIPDDDRGLTVSGTNVNEASPFVLWTVTGADGQTVFLDLAGTGTKPATPGTDTGTQLQVLVNGIWENYDPNNPPVIDGTELLVRLAVTQDDSPEGTESLNLIATNTGGTDFTGTSTINDEGQGDFYGPNNTDGLPDAPGENGLPADLIPDDDRVIAINDVSVNEGSQFAVFTLTGAAGQLALLSLTGASGNGSPDPAGGAADLRTGGNLPTIQVLSGTTWTNYDPLNPPALPAGGTLQVRVDISAEQDPGVDGPETFKLVANTTGGTVSTGGNATIKDDGTGDIFSFDPNTGAPSSASGPGAGFDDDRVLTVIGTNVNEASPYVLWTVGGADGQTVFLTLGAQGDSATPGTTPGPNTGDTTTGLEVLVNNQWLPYNPVQPPTIAGTQLLVRVAVNNDSTYEGREVLTLMATNTGGSSASAGSSISDDGSGSVFLPGNTSNTPNQPGEAGFPERLDDDRAVLTTTLKPATDSSQIGDRSTADGFAKLQIVAPPGLADRLSLTGSNGQLLLNGVEYQVREVTIDPGRSAYVIELLDADPNKAGKQAFGRYFQGASTGNNANSNDGTYTVLFNGQAVDSFEIRTERLSDRKRVKCLDALLGGNRSLESVLYGFRVEQPKGTNGDDALTGNARSNTLKGLRGNDLLNGAGDRLAGDAITQTNPNEIDTLIGGKGRDTFQLGDIAGSFYLTGGNNDYARIKDFSKGDTLLLSGSPSDYSIERRVRINGQSGVGLYAGSGEDRDLVALIQGKSANSLDLTNPSQVTFL
ncbi:MAG: VCBS domain-containing protein [Prochlorococcaceae cyanobacterium]